MSHARTNANRANAAKSTGPVTPAGKAAIAQNALKHGLAAKRVVLPDESRADYKFLLHGYLDRFQPQDTVEFELVATMAAARWRLRRIGAIETSLFFNEMALREEAITDALTVAATPDDRLAYAFKKLTDASQSASLVVRYEGTLTRVHDRAFRQLEALRNPKKSPATNQSQFSAKPAPPRPTRSTT